MSGLSFVSYLGDNVTTDFVATFALGYLSRNDVHVYVEGTEVSYIWVETLPGEDELIRLASAPLLNEKVLIRRIVDSTSVQHVFQDGSIINEISLDESHKQSLMVAHETQDGFGPGTGDRIQSTDLNMNFNKIYNLEDGVNPQDAVNYRQTMSIIDDASDIRDEAEAARDAAEDARDESEGHANDSASSATEAEGQADRAEAAAATATATVGAIKFFTEDITNRPTRFGFLLPAGQLVSRIDYSSLWNVIANGGENAVTDAEWHAGKQYLYSTGDGSTNFRLPLLNNKIVSIGSVPELEVERNAMPVGTIVAKVDNSFSPVGWITCNGQSTASYPECVALGITHAPELRGEFIRGWDEGRGIDVGRVEGSWQEDTMQRITGTIESGNAGQPKYGTSGGVGALATLRNEVVENLGHGNLGGHSGISFDSARVTRTSHETRPRNVALRYIMKVATQSEDVLGTRVQSLQSYIVVTATRTDGTGIRLRGAWDVALNVVSGDALNTSVTKAVAPVVTAGDDPTAQGYLVSKSGSFDLNDDVVGPENFVAGDRISWIPTNLGNPTVGSWVHIKLAQVTSVNGEQGDVVFDVTDVGGDTVSTIDTKIANAVQAAIAPLLKSVVPVGAIAMVSSWAAITPYWRTLEGQSTAGMPALIITMFGTNFPDTRGEFIRGFDHGRGADPGRTENSWQGDTMQRIWGSFGGARVGSYDSSFAEGVFGKVPLGVRAGADSSSNGVKYTFDSDWQTRTSHETRPRNIALRYIIYVGVP